MVLLTLCRCGSGSAKRTFIDNVRVYARGGGGGQGLPRYGGLGGRGGSVYVVGEERATLKNLARDPNKRRCIGESGQNSKPMTLQGAPGKDVELLVPPGVEVVNDAGRVLGEVNEPGERVLVARGGAGGGPANNFLGQRASPINLRLNLKLIADVGLVGFPNAGKSTLLSAISRAAPKIASYAFTTIQPQIGTIGYTDGRQVSVADLPGLIEGAHLNVGMGHKFLKHVERTKMLLFVVDLHGFRLDLKHHPRTAVETVLLLNKELELYKPELLSKPCVLVLNKVDIAHPRTELPREELPHTDLPHTDLPRTDLPHTDLPHTDLPRTELPHTELPHTDLPHSDLPHSDLLTRTLQEVSNLSTTTHHHLPHELLPRTVVHFDYILPISAKECVGTEELTDKIRRLLDVYADRDRAREEAEQRLQVTDGRQRNNKLVTPGERGRLLV